MKIERVMDNKKQFLDLLLIADEQESMIDKYIERGDLFALYDDDLKTICVVTHEGDGVYEIKNIATYEKYQKQGYGKIIIEYVFAYYKGKCKTMLVGTGDNARIISFYKRCGFTISHRVKNFFTDNYDHPMYECGEQLIDMIYLKKTFKE